MLRFWPQHLNSGLEPNTWTSKLNSGICVHNDSLWSLSRKASVCGLGSCSHILISAYDELMTFHGCLFWGCVCRALMLRKSFSYSGDKPAACDFYFFISENKKRCFCPLLGHTLPFPPRAHHFPTLHYFDNAFWKTFYCESFVLLITSSLLPAP